MTIEWLLEAHSEPLADEKDLDGCLKAFLARSEAPSQLLWHQAATYQALASHGLVYNTSATGTGKTIAAQLQLLRGAQVTVVIAPTNALVDQHERDWAQFCAWAGLPHQVVGLDAARLRCIQVHTEGPSANNARRLYEVLTNPQQVLGHPPGTPLVLVTNPDLFYMATFFRYRRAKQHAALAFLHHVDYLVVDEFHYYSGLQLVAFFFVVGWWHATGRFVEENRRICLLTATPEAEVQKLLGALEARGLCFAAVCPENAPPERPRVRSLAPCYLRCVRDKHQRTTQVGALLDEWLPSLDKGQEIAVLLDSLRAVGELSSALSPTLGPRVRRLTGPTPREQRQDAAAAPLLLATPTVDIGFNFMTHQPNKQRQWLDQVIFEAPSRAHFWQRLGRVGRVLRALEKDVPSHAIAVLPGHVMNALEALPHTESVTRRELAEALDSLGDEYRDVRIAPLLTEWAAFALAQPFARIYESVAPENQAVVEVLWEELVGLFGETQRSLQGYLAELRSFQEARELAEGQKQTQVRLGWLRDKGHPASDSVKEEVRRFARQSPQFLRQIAAEQLACFDAALAFRGAGQIGTDVIAWDDRGLYADSPSWVVLSLEECLRNNAFSLLKETARLRLPVPPKGWGNPLFCRLEQRLLSPRRLRLVLDLEPHCKAHHYQGYLSGCSEFCIEAEGEPLPEEIVNLPQQRPIPFFIPRALLPLQQRAAGVLSHTRFVFRKVNGQEFERSGFIGQHAVLADALVRLYHRQQPDA